MTARYSAVNFETPPQTRCHKSSCGCGGHGPRAAAPEVRGIISMNFDPQAAHKCDCNRRACPRHYLALTGVALGGFLILHIVVNALGFWPSRFQTAVNRNHALGAALPVLEVGLVFLPLAIHAALGTRTLLRERFKFGVEKRHHGSDLRQWLQRVSAAVLLLFITFHVGTMHRWFGGRFDSQNAFDSTSAAIRCFWTARGASSMANILLAWFYLLGIAAAVYHLANGISTSADVWDLTPTPSSKSGFWKLCVVVGLGLAAVGLVAWYAFAVRQKAL